jgi:hypothetical protein
MTPPHFETPTNENPADNDLACAATNTGARRGKQDCERCRWDAHAGNHGGLMPSLASLVVMMTQASRASSGLWHAAKAAQPCRVGSPAHVEVTEPALQVAGHSRW